MSRALLFSLIITGVLRSEPLSQVETAPDAAKLDRRIEVSPTLSVASFSTLTLLNEGVRYDYSNAINGLPALHFAMGFPLVRSDGFRALLQGSLGFSTKSGFNGSRTRGSVELSPSEAQVTWFPLLAGVRLEYQFSQFPMVVPCLILGGGVHGLYHRSYADRVSQLAWIPTFFAKPALTFLAGQPGEDDWFGGFTFGSSLHTQFGSVHEAEGMSFDLSVNFYL